jgi:glucose-6-phosphate dehydrogenase assembly protein OpcA
MEEPVSATAVSSGAVSEAVAKVEAELGAFWAGSSDGGYGGDGAEGEATPKVRASTMNFVVASASGELEKERAAMEALAETRAGRTFLFTVDGRLAPWEITSDVGAVCHKEGDEVICYDRIEIAFGAMAAARAASVVGALALAEVHLLVEVGAHAPATLVDPLAAHASRLIVDSAHTSVFRIAELAGRTKAPIADRQFVRTFTWRELTARFFDSMLPALRDIRRVEVARTPAPRGDAASLLLGWLGSRMGWKLESRTLAVSKGGQAIAIAVSDDARTDLGPGELTAVAFSTTEGGAPLELRCARTSDPRTVEWSMEGTRSARSRLPLGFRDETWVLLKAIDATESDRIYREAVLAAAAWEGR